MSENLTAEEFAEVRASLILPSTKQGVADYLAFVTNMREFVHAYDAAIARAEAAEAKVVALISVKQDPAP